MYRCNARLAWLATALLLAIPASGISAPRRYEVDAARSQVDFRLHYFGLFNPGGRFRRAAGTVAFDPGHWETVAVAVRIPVDSLETRPALWRSELLGPGFFDSGRYPNIEFSSTRAEQTTNATADVWGSLTLRGVTRSVLLKARIVPATTAGAFAIEAEARLQRSAFGLDAVLPFASDEVTIILHLTVVPMR